MQGEILALLTGGAMVSAEAVMALAAGNQAEEDAPDQEEVSLSCIYCTRTHCGLWYMPAYGLSSTCCGKDRTGAGLRNTRSHYIEACCAATHKF